MWLLIQYILYSDGIAEYLCGYYDGDEDICPDPYIQEYGPICMSVCPACNDDTVKQMVEDITRGNLNVLV